MMILNNIKHCLEIITDYVIKEFKTILTRYSIVLVLVGGVFVYGLLYNYMYQPNLIRNAPIALVDESNTPLSREYSRLLDASEQVKVYSHAPNMESAKDMMKTNEVTGIIFIPHDFERRIGLGEQSVFVAFADTRAFLNYSTIQEGVSGAMLELDDRHRPEMVAHLPLMTLYTMSMSQSINVVGTPLYNYTEGYGSYLIPAVLIIVIFQTLMMVIGMISGAERHSNDILYYSKHGTRFKNMALVIVSKVFVYFCLYTIFAYFLIGLLPHIFSIPNIGNKFDIVMLLIPFLIASSCFGLAGSFFFTDSESPILMIAFFSVGLIFLSGISYPLELMPWYWKAAHFVFPAAPGVLAFVKLNSMGATMEEIQTEYITLWVQCIIYFVLACLVYRYNIYKAMKGSIKKDPIK